MVGLWLPPSVGGALPTSPLALLGKTSVNLNYTSSPEIVQSAPQAVRHQARPDVAGCSRTRCKLDPGPGVELVYLEDFRKSVTSWERLRTYLSVLLLPRLRAGCLAAGACAEHTADDLATVIFSSGSTGEPKGVMLTHGNIAANVESMIQAIDLDAERPRSWASCRSSTASATR